MDASLRRVTPLQKLVTDRLAELNRSYRQAAEESNGLVSHATINHIALGRTSWQRLPDKTLRGLALALDVPYSRVKTAWDESKNVPETTFILPKSAEQLTPKQRKAVLAFVSALLEENKLDGNGRKM